MEAQIRGRRGPNPPLIQGENDWWALGQHHGLATPLLDWTTSPFVAAYFAFIRRGKGQTRYRAVYALYRPAIEATVTTLLETEMEKRREKERIQQKKDPRTLAWQTVPNVLHLRPQVEFIRPLSDENQSMLHQGGLFTRSPDKISLEEWIRRHFQGDTSWSLVKILIPNKDRLNCLKALNRMNINHLTLFPDVYGACKYCNCFAEIKEY